MQYGLPGAPSTFLVRSLVPMAFGPGASLPRKKVQDEGNTALVAKQQNMTRSQTMHTNGRAGFMQRRLQLDE